MRRLAFVILAVVLAAATAFAGQAARRVQAVEPLEAVVDRLAAGEFAPDAPGGALIVVKDGKTLLRKGYGLADMELGVPVRPDMIFRVGSVTKQFTAALVLMLVDEGKIALDDDVAKYLPGYGSPGRHITVEHLLTHTSGIKDYTRLPALMAEANADKPVSAVLDTLKPLPLDFEPGEDMRYTNSGYYLLGAILEQVTGTPYAQLLQQRIFKPLGMKHSSYIDNAPILTGRAHGYQEVNGTLVNARYYSNALPYSAGGVMSSVDDLALWDAALSGDRLLRKESRDRMFSPFKLRNGRDAGYGYGWYALDHDGLHLREHGGVIFGFVAYVLRIPEHRTYVALLTNRQTSRAEPFLFARKVALAALGRPFVDPPAAVARLAAIDSVAGYYESATKAGVEFLVTSSRLTMKRGRGEPVELQASSAITFFQKGTFLRVAVDKDASGRVQRITISDWGNVMTVTPAVKPTPRG